MNNTLLNSSVNNSVKYFQSLREYIIEEKSKRGHQDIWFNDISVLFDPALLLEIIPTTDMTMGEKINAITRFTFLLSLLLTIVKQNYVYVYVFIIPVIVTYIVYLFSPNSREYFKDTTDLEDNTINNEKSDEDLNRVMEEALEDCQGPTFDNPFMNLLPTDNFQKRKPACNINDPNVAKLVNEKLDKSITDRLYTDTTNIYNPQISHRDFYTMPISRVPNDQGAFAKWLYQTPVSCAIAETGTLKQVRACAFNNKSMEELRDELRETHYGKPTEQILN